MESTCYLDELEKYFAHPRQFPARQIAEAYGLDYFEAADEQSLRGVFRQFLSAPRAALLAVDTPAEESARILRNYFNRKSEYINHKTNRHMRNWTTIKQYEDILFERLGGIAKITINRPKVYNAFRPQTNMEMLDAMAYCRECPEIGVVILTGAGDKAFCSGGDQNVKGTGGYIDSNGVPRLNVLDLHKAIRSIPKPVIAMVNGYAIGGGNVLQVVCDLTIASENARFGQTGPKVGSFDAGFGSSYLARCVGQKKAREIWFLCRQYTAQEAEEMGMVNKVVPFDRLEDETVEWCETILKRSPMAIRMIKRALNAELDGQRGLMEFAGDATLLYYLMEGSPGRQERIS